jgi:hypothetical protein
MAERMHASKLARNTETVSASAQIANPQCVSLPTSSPTAKPRFPLPLPAPPSPWPLQVPAAQAT